MMQQSVRLLTCMVVLCALLTAPAAIALPGSEHEPSQRMATRVAGPGLTPSHLALPNTPSAEYVPGELVVAFRRAADRDAQLRVREQAGAESSSRLPLSGARLLSLSDGVGALNAARRVADDPAVRFAQPNYIRSTAALPNDPRFDELWGLHNTGQQVRGESGTPDADIDAPEAWDTETGDPATTVAIVDTGLDLGHEELAPNIWSNPGEVGGLAANGVDDDGNGFVDDWRGWDFIDDDPVPQDRNGHGSHVASTIGAAGDNATGVTGVAWDVSLMPLRVLDAFGAGSDADIASAFVYAGENGARIVNASLGAAVPSPLLRDAIESQPQTLFVIAAGNAAEDNDRFPQYPCALEAVNVICVAASEQSDNLASFSNYGPLSTDLAAPGTNILGVRGEDTSEYAFMDMFGPTLAWTTGGVKNTWATMELEPNAWVLTDSPGGPYAPNTNSYAQSPPLDLSGFTYCEANLSLLLRTEYRKDYLYLEASANGVNWTRAGAWTGEGEGNPRVELASLAGSPTAALRFRLVADGAQQRAGAFIDDIRVRCLSGPAGYTFLQGTSMAAPHVAGVAALVASAQPSLSMVRFRGAVLDSVDPITALQGAVASGGRLNASNALDAAADGPDTWITSGPDPWTADPMPSFEFDSEAAGSSFECSVDGSAFTPCSGPGARHEVVAPLSEGLHDFTVRALDSSANPDPWPAHRRFAVDLTPPNTSLMPGGSLFGGSGWADLDPPLSGTSQVVIWALLDDVRHRLECRLDGTTWTECPVAGSPTFLPLVLQYVLPDGIHTLEARSYDQAGNPDPTPAVLQFTVDTTEPETTITKHPPRKTRRHRVRFEFTANEEATFFCSVEGVPGVGLCKSPARYRLRHGRYRFSVRATDAANHSDPTSETWRFRIVP